jgi:hypothetical protein
MIYPQYDKDAYDVAISVAAKETGLDGKVFPKECPYRN